MKFTRRIRDLFQLSLLPATNLQICSDLPYPPNAQYGHCSATLLFNAQTSRFLPLIQMNTYSPFLPFIIPSFFPQLSLLSHNTTSQLSLHSHNTTCSLLILLSRSGTGTNQSRRKRSQPEEVSILSCYVFNLYLSLSYFQFITFTIFLSFKPLLSTRHITYSIILHGRFAPNKSILHVPSYCMFVCQ